MTAVRQVLYVIDLLSEASKIGVESYFFYKIKHLLLAIVKVLILYACIQL
jgi:hypothetical protein